ncbi:mandelate racemase/muconate lactonizing enzyme family protein [Limibaculum sp. FT325]|uniref:mandelate racemase/muconate lactonizing enzyme family protein n=1 Tax=Thermohalobaculum sediminis TaxID=2939436 RepID=UPI0020C00AB0|nr:mandelate racemase/muconate lactonizing enzyme family protein [Limibaculum sediminis]MCL5775857.1 mandelate racemase/muconate lactonizing enzyme family protein [Limibaculum sediminis]
MKLSDCEVFIIGNPPPRKGGRYFIVVKLTTACGVTGIGEVYAHAFGPKVVKAMVEDVFARHFEGADPHRIEHLWRLTYGSGYSLRPDPTLTGVLSGLEVACWDIVGKSADKPICDLLGGRCRDRLRSYTYIYPAEGDTYPDPNLPNAYNDPDIAAERAAHYLSLGFTALKFDPAGPYTVFDGHEPSLEDLDRSERFCRVLREAVGTRADLLFGTHGQFTVSGAKRLARRIEPYDPLWFEEPVPPDMPEAMAEVQRSTSVPVATGERLSTKWEFARVLETGAARILQPQLGRVGGILEGKKIAAMAEAKYVQLAPHLYCGPVGGAANIQLSLCIPNFLILESIERWEGFHAKLLRKPIRWEDGHVLPPQGPGLGIELDEEVARAHPYEGDELHLLMAGESV